MAFSPGRGFQEKIWAMLADKTTEFFDRDTGYLEF
jgi:hypothetical protein